MEVNKPRTSSQNNAMHKYFEQVAAALNDAGISRYEYIELLKTKGIELTWTKENVKKEMWTVIQSAMYEKDKTRELEKIEVDSVYENMNRFLARYGIHVPFPSEESMMEEQR